MERFSRIVVVLAAGSGSRLGPGVPKQYRLLGNVPLLRRTLQRLEEAKDHFHRAVIVIQPEHQPLYEQGVEGFESWLLSPVFGGATRQASVHAALKAIERYDPEHVVLHDAARCFVSPDLIQQAFDALKHAKGAICASPVTDTLKKARQGYVIETVPRESIYTAQTPQAFHFGVLLAAHGKAVEQGIHDYTDDAALLECQGENVAIIESDNSNFKVTTEADWKRAETRLALNVSRFALGYDVHSFKPGNHVMLGGVKIPHTQGIEAHSDGDVILHALTDALLGLTGQGDIGTHFPPSDPQWRGQASHRFVEKALHFAREKEMRLTHCDITVLAEAPKLAIYREAICKNVAELTGLGENAVSLKATTGEGLGFIGRGEGLAAFVLVNAEFPP